jgi:hypothetical protein
MEFLLLEEIKTLNKLKDVNLIVFFFMILNNKIVLPTLWLA